MRFYKRVIPIGTAAAVAVLVAYTLAAPSMPEGVSLLNAIQDVYLDKSVTVA